MTNNSGIKPVDTKALVMLDPAEVKTAGGIILPDSATEKQKYATQKATLIAIGKSCFAEWLESPEPGSRILIAQYSGTLIKGADGQEYRIINDEDICALLEEIA